MREREIKTLLQEIKDFEENHKDLPHFKCEYTFIREDYYQKSIEWWKNKIVLKRRSGLCRNTKRFYFSKIVFHKQKWLLEHVLLFINYFKQQLQSHRQRLLEEYERWMLIDYEKGRKDT